MIISTDRLIPYMLVFIGILCAGYAYYSIKTGKIDIRYIEIDKQKQPIFFIIQLYTVIAMSIGSFVLAILDFLGVVH